MKRIILFLIAFNFLNFAHGQWKREYSPDHSYHHFYSDISVGADQTIGTLGIDYIFKYDDYFIQPYAGAHVGFMGFWALWANTAGYAGINFRYISIEAGVGNQFITFEGRSANFQYSFWRIGIQTKYGILKAGPSQFYPKDFEGVFPKIITINNQQWTVSLLLDIKELDKF